jgi:lysophospholipase L1-like esterase
MKKSLLLLYIFTMLTSFSPQKELKWAALGDSITFLDGHPGEANNRITKGYMTRVTEQLPYIHFTNHGHNGWTTQHMADAVEKDGIEKADIYTVFFGTNDWWWPKPLGTMADYQHNTGSATTYGAYRIIINKLRSLNPNAHIILVTPMQRGDFVHVKRNLTNAYGSYRKKNGHNLSEFADAIKNIARAEHFALIDLYYKSGITLENVVKYKRLKDPQTGEYKKYIYPDYTKVPFNPATDEYPYPLDAIGMTYDGLHPSDKGLTIIADMLVNVMKKY